MSDLHNGKVLVTGATGFVGRALCGRLTAVGHRIIPVVRRRSGLLNEVVIGEMDSSTDWSTALAGCDVVVHLAASVHKMKDGVHDSRGLYSENNTEATLNIGHHTAKEGVKRFD